MLLWRYALFAYAIGICAPAAANEPSFDCSNASTPDEVTICRSKTLSKLDKLTTQGFLYIKKHVDTQSARNLARAVLNRRSQCGGDFYCIATIQVAAIDMYRDYGAPLPRVQIPSTNDTEPPELRGEIIAEQVRLQDEWRHCLLTFAAQSVDSGNEPAIVILKGSFAFCSNHEAQLFQHFDAPGGTAAKLATRDLFPAIKVHNEDLVLALILKLRHAQNNPSQKDQSKPDRDT